MSYDNKESTDTILSDKSLEDSDVPCPKRRRLLTMLTMLGMGIAAAYVAPTLFSVGEAQAWDRRDRRNKHGKRGSYSRASYSRMSGYDYRGRERSRLRDYQNDPVLILEDVILGPPRR